MTTKKDAIIIKKINNYFIAHPLINERAFYLYEIGNNDRHIAIKLNKKFNTTLSSADIRFWRKINNLSPTGNIGGVSCKITDRVGDKIISMRKDGKSIREISLELGIPPAKLSVWSSLNYPAIEERNKIKMQFYNSGLVDKEIADRLGFSTTAIYLWRKKYNLPSNYKYQT